MFKAEFSLDKRIEVSGKIRSKYPDRVPVIVERAAGADLPQIEKRKFLVPKDINVGGFGFEIRKHLPTLDPKKSIFLFVNDDTLPPTAAYMHQIYERYHDEDGFLYIQYKDESVFG
eukprot:TRINITY_DN114_c0_g1_i1.p1 TRINITY_DN114_c0_g1~~TRINITY_DN114_c0_g1_i1.p1  ORF type:complete len:116 (-),score=18.93 TRINITY_DN114_c0_g1_i1:51-398(-)